MWWDRSIPTGRTFDEVIEEAIDDAKCVIVLWSEGSVGSRWVRTEAQEGLDRGVLLPILIDDVKIPLAFRRVQAANLIGWDGHQAAPAVESLVADVERLVGPPRRAGRASTAERDKARLDASPVGAREETSPSTSAHSAPASARKGPVHRVEPGKRGETRAAQSATGGTGPRSAPSPWLKPGAVGAVGVIVAVIGWQFLPSASPLNPRIGDFDASAASITAGESLTLTWTATEVDSVALAPGEGTVPATGSMSVSPDEDTEYVLTAYGAGRQAQRTVSVEVTSAPIAALDTGPNPGLEPRIDAFRASATSIMAGRDVTLTWNTTDATRVELRPGGPVALDGSTVLTPRQTTTYMLVAAGGGGETEQLVTVSVSPPTLTPSAGRADPLNPAIWIQGGTFQMGGESAFDRGLPVHQVTVSSFWIQEHEVTNEEYRRFDPSHSFPAGQERYPVGRVEWRQAMEYAEWRGGSLPTEAQWEFAARGTEGRRFPWGDADWTCQLAHASPCTPGTPKTPLPVKSLPAGATPEGVHDLAGNISEWVADWYGPYSSPAQTDPTGPASGTTRILRGGSFRDGTALLQGWKRGYPVPGFRAGENGFRVAWSS